MLTWTAGAGAPCRCPAGSRRRHHIDEGLPVGHARDIIIGCFNRYSPGDVMPWASSIAASGFAGDKLAIVYGNGFAEHRSATYLADCGFRVDAHHVCTKSIAVDRFRDMAAYLSRHQGRYRHVIATDVGDVVFQLNPSPFLETRLGDGKGILVGSECVRYQDETWGRANLLASYPAEAAMMMNQVIYNAGSFAVRADMAEEFLVDIHHKSHSVCLPNPDQAALNILVQTKYRDRTHFSSMADGWSIQCGTVADPIRRREYGHLLVEKDCSFVGGVGYNQAGQQVCLVHQYNRVPAVAGAVRARYAGTGSAPGYVRELVRWLGGTRSA